jgi:hypothetical protein
LSGYDFKLYRWKKHQGSHRSLVEWERLEHSFTVPDGMWVMRQLYAHKPESIVLGLSDSLNLGRKIRNGWDDTLLFSPEPFCVIQVVYGDAPDGNPFDVPHGAYLYRAQEIHRGELGRFVEVRLPLIARELIPWGSNRDRKRGDGWVRLTEAAYVAGLSVEQFVLDHWLFVEAHDRSDYGDQFKDVRIELIHAQRREMIHKQVITSDQRISLTRDEFESLCPIDDTDWSHYWIRRGFARTVLLLQRYGWNKSVERNLLGERQTA